MTVQLNSALSIFLRLLRALYYQVLVYQVTLPSHLSPHSLHFRQLKTLKTTENGLEVQGLQIQKCGSY